MIISRSTESTVTFGATSSCTEVVADGITFLVFDKPLTLTSVEVNTPHTHVIVLAPISTANSFTVNSTHFIALAAISAGGDFIVHPNGRAIIATSVNAGGDVKLVARNHVFMGSIPGQEQIVELFQQALAEQDGERFIRACLSLSDLPTDLLPLPQASRMAIAPTSEIE